MIIIILIRISPSQRFSEGSYCQCGDNDSLTKVKKNNTIFFIFKAINKTPTVTQMYYTKN